MKSNEPNRKGRPKPDADRFFRGLLFLEDGRRLSPTHTTKSSRRYSYYLAVADRAANTCTIRIPALELERAVVGAIGQLFADPVRVAEHFGTLLIHNTQRLLACCQARQVQLADLESPAARALARSMVRRVRAETEALTIELDHFSLDDETASMSSASVSKRITLTLPFYIKRQGRQARVVLAGGSPEAEPISSLIRAVTMARDWAYRIAAG